MSSMSVGNDMWWILTLFFSMNTCFGDMCALSETFKDSHQSHISAVLQVELTEGAGQLKYCFQLEAASWRSLEGLRIRPKDHILFKTNMLTETTWPLRAKGCCTSRHWAMATGKKKLYSNTSSEKQCKKLAVLFCTMSIPYKYKNAR